MARSFLAPGVVTLFPMILYIGIPIFSLASSFDYPMNHYVVRQTGNPIVARDVYGVGLRVGAYLQLFGMLLLCLRSGAASSTTVLVLSSSICLSLCTALTILAARHSISPCEVWLILSLTAAYGNLRFFAIQDKNHPKAGFPAVYGLVSVVWQQVLSFWFWTTLYRELPLLGTANLGWFFVPVDLAGWFRIFMLVVTCLESLMTTIVIGPYLDLIIIRFSIWTRAELGEDEDSKMDCWDKTLFAAGKWAKELRSNTYFNEFTDFGANLSWYLSRILSRPGPPLNAGLEGGEAEMGAGHEQSETPELVRLRAELESARAVLSKLEMELERWKLVLWVKGSVVLVLTIAGIEKIIKYNSLSPTSDLSEPGQIVPLISGIITFIDGASNAIKPGLFKDAARLYYYWRPY